MLGMDTTATSEDIALLRSFAISIVGRDKEGTYRPEFVRRVRTKLREKATKRFSGADAFLKEVRRLPKAQQEKLAQLFELMTHDPYDSRLHTKHLSAELVGLLSFRITRDWRVLFRFVDERTIQLVDVGHRKDIYKP